MAKTFTAVNSAPFKASARIPHAIPSDLEELERMTICKQVTKIVKAIDSDGDKTFFIQCVTIGSYGKRLNINFCSGGYIFAISKNNGKFFITQYDEKMTITQLETALPLHKFVGNKHFNGQFVWRTIGNIIHNWNEF